MNFSHYKGLVDSAKVHKFIFAQGNRPAAELVDGQTLYLSETFLFKEDMDSIYEEIVSSRDLDDQSVFFIDGGKFSYHELKLKDTSQISVYPQVLNEMNWLDLQVPGYVNDWTEARSGIIIFYGSNVNFVERVRLSFSKRRAEILKGTSIVFSSKQTESLVSNEGHFLTSSVDEEGFLNSNSDLKFDSYSFMGDISNIGGEKVLRIADKSSLVIMNSYWSDISKVWSDIFDSFTKENSRRFFLESVVGFVGVKKVTADDDHGRVVFEALPMPPLKDLAETSFKDQIESVKKSLKTNGVSFNQSIHSLVIKRKLSLDSAYKASPDPEELNKFLSESGV